VILRSAVYRLAINSSDKLFVECETYERLRARCYFARRYAGLHRRQMSLQHELQPTQIYRFTKYLGGASGNSTIENTSLGEKAVSTITGMSRVVGSAERCYGLITSTGGHTKIHDDQIGTGRSCLPYRLKPVAASTVS
jgi:hypothetical protein